jgi:chemotaxis signal transduction protein
MGFASGGRWFAIDVAAVAEIVPRGTVVPMPRTPPHVLGVTAYRGQVIAVIDLARLLGEAGATPPSGNPRLVVLQGEGCRLAIPASGVTDVLELAPCALHPSPAGPSSEGDPIDGCVEAEGRLLSRLRMDRLVERVAVAGG